MAATYVDFKALESDVQALVAEGHPNLSDNALSNLLDLATDANTETARAYWTNKLLDEYNVEAPVREHYVREYEEAAPDSERPEPSYTTTATDTTPESPEDDDETEDDETDD